MESQVEEIKLFPAYEPGVGSPVEIERALQPGRGAAKHREGGRMRLGL